MSTTGDAAATEVAPVLELQTVSKHFGGVLAVDRVSLEVRPDEVVGLVGNNGAGKSTVMRMVSGVHTPDSGEVRLSGKPMHFHGPRDARAWGIEPVPQELALARHLSVAANIFLGREMTKGFGPFRVLDKKAMARRSAELVEGFGIHIPNLRARVHDLSGGQQQGVAIGRAVAWGSRLIVLDEPTAALGIHETAQVEETIRGMRGTGVSVLLVSHQLDQVFRVADRVYVLRRGRLVGQRRTAEADPDEIVGMITGTQREDAADLASGREVDHDQHA